MEFNLPSPHGDKPGGAVDLHVGLRLRAQRISHGLSISTMAVALAVSDDRLADWEVGVYRIPAHHLLAASALLSCPLASFFEGYPTEGAVDDDVDPSETKVNWLFNRLAGAKN